MSDEDSKMWTAWIPGDAIGRADVETVLSATRAAQQRERWSRAGALIAQAVLVPLLVWCAARGVTSLVRGAYALMAVGSAACGVAEWMYLDWSRRALPGPVDTRSQLQTTAFMVARQATLVTTAIVWSSPVFIGTGLIGMWLYRERTHSAAIAIWAVAALAWGAVGLGTAVTRRRLEARGRELERLLGEMS